MPTNSQRIATLEAWQKAHKAEHAAKPLHHHGAPPPPPPPPPDPDPDPPPPPTGRPWAAPVAPVTVRYTTGDPQALIDATADGSVIDFMGATFTRSVGLKLERRKHLVLRNATLKMTGPGSQDNSSALIARASSNIAFEDFILVGSDPGPLTSSRGENAHALSVSGWYGGAPNSYIEIARCTASKFHGDFAYLEGENVGAHRPSDHIWIHHNKATDITRNFVSPINSTDILCEDNETDRIGYHWFDIEPNLGSEQVRRVIVRRNKVGSYGHRTNLLGFLLRNWNPPNSSPVSDIRFEDNEVTGNPSAGYGGAPLGLNTRFDSPSSKVRFTGNRTTRAVPGPALIFHNVAGIHVDGNVQPLTSGSLASYSGSTGRTGAQA